MTSGNIVMDLCVGGSVYSQEASDEIGLISTQLKKQGR
jgi:hypothetical protein